MTQHQNILKFVLSIILVLVAAGQASAQEITAPLKRQFSIVVDRVVEGDLAYGLNSHSLDGNGQQMWTISDGWDGMPNAIFCNSGYIDGIDVSGMKFQFDSQEKFNQTYLIMTEQPSRVALVLDLYTMRVVEVKSVTGQTAAEKLKSAYDSATEPATISDFDAYKARSNQQCVLAQVGSSDLNPTFGLQIKVLTRTTQASSASPGNVEQTLAMGDFSKWNFTPYAYFDAFKLSSNPKDLVLTIDKSGVFSDLGTSLVVTMRKSQGQVIFKVLEGNGVGYYGHCQR